MSSLLRDKAPGQRECDQAIDLLNQTVRELDQASLAAISQQLAPREGISQEVRDRIKGELCRGRNRIIKY